MKFNVADENGVRVRTEMCATCIFHPGNKMDLRTGRLKDLVESVRKADSCIVCHELLEEEFQAVCRGQFDAFKTQPLQIAERLDRIVWVP